MIDLERSALHFHVDGDQDVEADELFRQSFQVLAGETQGRCRYLEGEKVPFPAVEPPEEFQAVGAGEEGEEAAVVLLGRQPFGVTVSGAGEEGGEGQIPYCG